MFITDWKTKLQLHQCTHKFTFINILFGLIDVLGVSGRVVTVVPVLQF